MSPRRNATAPSIYKGAGRSLALNLMNPSLEGGVAPLVSTGEGPADGISTAEFWGRGSNAFMCSCRNPHAPLILVPAALTGLR